LKQIATASITTQKRQQNYCTPQAEKKHCKSWGWP